MRCITAPILLLLKDDERRALLEDLEVSERDARAIEALLRPAVWRQKAQRRAARALRGDRLNRPSVVAMANDVMDLCEELDRVRRVYRARDNVRYKKTLAMRTRIHDLINGRASEKSVLDACAIGEAEDLAEYGEPEFLAELERKQRKRDDRSDERRARDIEDLEEREAAATLAFRKGAL